MKRQLAQVRPIGTTAELLYSSPDNKPYTIHLINICNTGSSDICVSIFHDVDGTTYDEDTALLWRCPILTGGVLPYEVEISDYRKTGNIAVQTNIAGSANFTAYGKKDGEVI